MRHESKKSKRTRVLVVTEGVLVRRLQSDPLDPALTMAPVLVLTIALAPTLTLAPAPDLAPARAPPLLF